MLRRQSAILLVAAILLGSIGLVFAQPNYLEQFKSDPYRKPGEATCLTCHVDESGGGHNAFGEAFLNGSMEITPLLRSQFPDLFAYPTSKIGDAVVIHFSDPDNKEIVLETGGKRIVVDVGQKKVGGKAVAVP